MGKMKQTGIRWIGEIPSEWNTKRIKYMATLKGRIGWQGLTSEEYQDEGAFLITGVDFANGGINWEQCEHVPMKRWEEAKDIQIQNGDLLITKDGTVGKVAIVSDMPGETSLNSGVLRIMPIEGYSQRFLYWVLQSEVFWNWFNFRNAGNSTIIHLYQGDFAEFIYAYPMLEEQEKIADFLDDECAKLDDIVTDLENQMNVLRDRKKSLLFESVTKGLNEETIYTDSGYPWIGKMPVEWKVEKIKYVSEKIGSGKTPKGGAEIYVDEGITFIRSQNVYDEGLYLDDVKYIDDYTNKDMVGTQLKKGDVLFNITGASIARCCIYDIDEPGNVNQHVCIIRTKNTVDNRYLRYVLNSLVGKYQTASNQMGGNRESLTFEQIGMFVIPFPPLAEQTGIADYLDEECSKIEQILEVKSEQLKTIKDYKKSFIYAYVTGKKRLKEVM